MSSLRPVTIVGGGLAGLSLGILLRQRAVPVTLFEAGTYPRHRVCGEFLSGRGLAEIERMGLLPRLAACGAKEAKTVLFTSGRASSGVQPLPKTALCISRFKLDAELAQIYVESGGTLREQERWQDGFDREGVVRATGRRPLPSGSRQRTLGLKAHARGARLDADLEVHLIPNAYVGICQLGDGLVNVCGLFRRAATAPDLAATWRDWLRGPEGSSLRARLRDAVFDEDSFCAVAGLDLQSKKGGLPVGCAIGDSLAMIAPVSGNGMSLAVESAAAAAPVLERYSRGDLGWEPARKAISQRFDEIFARRLWWAEKAHLGLLRAGIGDLMLRLIPRLPRLWRLVFEQTR